MVNQEYLVSVIMPAYNSEKFIEDSINSVLKQTYPNMELIVIDDLSTDRTVKIVEQFRKKDSRVLLEKNEVNLGVSETRNKGISLANGDWIAFLDSDDIWKRNKIEIQMKNANQANARFLFTGVTYINEENIPYRGTFKVPNKVSYKELLKQNVITCSSVLVKKSLFDSVKMKKDDTHEDYGAWLSILKNEPYAYGINQPLLIYRISKKSKSGNKIKSLLMAYKTYRYVGINSFCAIYNLFWYVCKNLRKYKNIKR